MARRQRDTRATVLACVCGHLRVFPNLWNLVLTNKLFEQYWEEIAGDQAHNLELKLMFFAGGSACFAALSEVARDSNKEVGSTILDILTEIREFLDSVSAPEDTCHLRTH